MKKWVRVRFCEIHHDFLKQLGQSVEDIVKYLQRLEFQVQSLSLKDSKLGNSFENCDYVYAHSERRNYVHLNYKYEEYGKVFEVFRLFSELDKEVSCPDCGSQKRRLFSIPHIEGETVTGAKFGPEYESPLKQFRAKERDG